MKKNFASGGIKFIPHKKGGKKAVGLDDFSRVLSLVITNEDSKKSEEDGSVPVVKKVRIFGSNLSQLEANPDNIQVLESDYIHLMKWLLSNKMTVSGFRVSYPNCSDVSKDEEIKKTLVWGVNRKNVFGMSAYYPINLLEFFKEDQNIKNTIEVLPYEIGIDGDTFIDIPVLNEVRVTFFISSIQIVTNKELLEKIEILQKRLSYYMGKIKGDGKPSKKSASRKKKKKSGKTSSKRK